MKTLSKDLLDGLKVSQVEEFNALCSIQKFQSKSLIIKDNNLINGVYIIKSGICQVYSLEEDGKEFVFTQLHSGEVIGEMSCLDNKPSSANVKTVTDCEVYFIEKEKFINFFLKNASFAINLTKIIIKRLRNADQQIERLAFLNVEQRIIELFKSLAIENKGKYTIQQSISTAEIAKSVGATREMCGKILRSLEKRGAIKFEKTETIINLKKY